MYLFHLFRSLLPPALAAKIIAHDPVTACADPLSAPAVDTAPDGREIRSDATQPFPFFGIITATREH